MRRPAVRRAATVLLAPLALSLVAGCGADPSDAGTTIEAEASGSGAERASDGSGEKGKKRKKKDRPAAGQGSASPDPAATSGPSAAPSATAPPSTQPSGETLTAAGFADRVKASLSGTLRMTMSVQGPMATTAEGDLDYSTTPPSMSVTMSNQQLGGDVDVVLVDGFVYMNMGPLSNGKYLKTSLEAPDGMMGADVTSQLDPRRSLEALEQGITSVRLAGREQLGGVQTTRYTATVDPARLGAGGAGLPKQITYDGWFDAQGKLRRTVLDMGGAAGVVTMNLSDWGQSVSIKAPPADQVTELPTPGR